jgi:N-acetylneuraminic acid mutarotase
MKIKIILLVNASLLLFACDKEAELEIKNYPAVVTGKVSNITDSSVVFNGSVNFIGQDTITEFGFLWDIVDPRLQKSNQVIFDSPAREGNFSKTIDFAILKDQVQYVRAYLKTNNLVVYGNIVSFKCNGGKPAIIDNIEPQSGYNNTFVTINGNYFGDSIKYVKVFFGDREAEIIYFSDTSIKVLVPEVTIDTKDKISLNIYGKTIFSSIKFQSYTYWKKLNSCPGEARYGAMYFVLNGKGYMGLGGQYEKDCLSDFWEYKPETDTWIKKKDFPGGARRDGIGFSANGYGYIGYGYKDYDLYYFDLWRYNASSDEWQKISFDDQRYIYGDPFFVINNKLYSVSCQPFIFDISTNQISNSFSFSGICRSYSTGISVGSKGYLICGQQAGNYFPNDFWEYNSEFASWTKKADFKFGARQGVTMFSINGIIYAGCGGAWNGEYNDFYKYDKSKNIWIRIQDLPGASRQRAVCFVINNKAYIGTGRDNYIGQYSDFYEFDPNKDK